MEKLKVFINGEFVESKTDVWYDLHNPSTGEITGQAPCCTTDEVEAAVQAAKAAFPGWSGTPAIKRAQIMYKIRELIIRDYERWRKRTERHGAKPTATLPRRKRAPSLRRR